MKKIEEARHMEASTDYEERAADRSDRLVAMRGKGTSSLWLPNNLLCNSRYYVDPELKAKYTSKVRTLKGAELERVKQELMAREAKR